MWEGMRRESPQGSARIKVLFYMENIWFLVVWFIEAKVRAYILRPRFDGSPWDSIPHTITQGLAFGRH